MTNAEAIESMHNLNALISITESEHESVRMAIKALEKQIVKRPHFYGDSEDGKLLCHNCQEDLWDIKDCGFNHCPYCGQRTEFNY